MHMQGKVHQSLRMQLRYNMIIQFKFQALRRFFRYHGCMLNGMIPLTVMFIRRIFSIQILGIQHPWHCHSQQMRRIKLIKFFIFQQQHGYDSTTIRESAAKKAAAYCTFFELAVWFGRPVQIVNQSGKETATIDESTF